MFHAGLIGNGGEILREELQKNGVDISLLKTVSVPCGHTVIQVDKDGQNSILLYGGSNRAISEDYVDEVMSHFEKGDYLVLQNEINEMPYIIDQAYKKGMVIVLNPSPYDENLSGCDLSKVSLFLINEVEGFQISGEKEPDRILGVMRQRYPEANVVLTLGGDGSCYMEGEKIYRQGIFPVTAVDTTAAGDTFTGYFISSAIEGKDPAECLRIAARASSISVTRPGAAGSIPLREEVLS